MMNGLSLPDDSESTSLGEFVEAWERKWRDSAKTPDTTYLHHVKWDGGDLTAEDVKILFEWKNRRRLPSWSPEPVIGQLGNLNRCRFRDSEELVRMATELSPTGPVKRFFICHIISPLCYPIWDRNVLTAHLVILGRTGETGDVKRLTKTEAEYLSFKSNFNRWAEHVDGRVEDEVMIPAFSR